MAFRYEYKPAGEGTKKVALVIATVILAFSIYSVGTTITSYITYSSSVESELNKTKADLAVYKAVTEECARDLSQKEQNLSVCESTLGSTYASLASCNQQAAALLSQSASLNASLSSCLGESTALKNTYGNLAESYNNLVRSSVKAICCSFGDIQSGGARSWNITSDRIVCSGLYSVNCTSGETTF